MKLPPRQALELTRFAREIAKCACAGILDFDTDLNGRVVERCRKCGHSQPMKRAVPKVPESAPVVESWPCPENCGRVVGWTGVGAKRIRCSECTADRQRLQSRDWQRKRNGRAA